MCVSRILRDQSFGSQFWDPSGHVHGWVRWMQVPPWPLYLVIREDPCILRLGRSAMLHDPRISKFWDKICSILPFRLSEKCKKSVSLKSPRMRLRSHTWLIPMGATLTWAVKALEKGDDTAAKTGFSVPFPETNLETTHREILSDLNILVFLLHRSQ